MSTITNKRLKNRNILSQRPAFLMYGRETWSVPLNIITLYLWLGEKSSHDVLVFFRSSIHCFVLFVYYPQLKHSVVHASFHWKYDVEVVPQCIYVHGRWWSDYEICCTRSSHGFLTSRSTSVRSSSRTRTSSEVSSHWTDSVGLLTLRYQRELHKCKHING
jgi:hypothetical protein